MAVSDTSEKKTIEDELSHPILLAERVRKLAQQSTSFKLQCSQIATKLDHISQMLRSVVRSAPVYDRPVRCIAADVTRNLNRTLSLLRKCRRRRRNFFRRLVNLITASDFRRVFVYLDASVADMSWLLSVLICASDVGDGGGIERTIPGDAVIVLSLPPIAGNDPILSWVWSFTATVQMSRQLPDRVEAANQLASLALDSDRNKSMIVEEGGVPPLIELLKESTFPEAQIAAAITLFNLVNVKERARVVVDCLGIGVIVEVLSDCSMSVQITVAKLVARMAEFDDVAREEFGRQNVIRPLVSLLSFETFDDDKISIYTIVEINKGKEMKERKDVLMKSRLSSSCSSVSSKYFDGGSSRGGRQTSKEKEMESYEVKRELKINCARALWMLAKDSVSNCQRITETKGLLCLAKLIEKEYGELRVNCLMTIMEITSAAELNVDLRRSTFKSNSPAGLAVVEQLLIMIKETNNNLYQIPAIRSIGSIARTFPAKETRVIGPLVEQLSCKDHEVGIESAIALGKFVCPDNFLCKEHAKSIIEFNAVIPLMRLLREGERAQLHGLILLCYLAINASDSEALEQARVLSALEGVDRTTAPQLRELIIQAIRHLDLYGSHIHSLRQSSLRVYK